MARRRRLLRRRDARRSRAHAAAVLRLHDIPLVGARHRAVRVDRGRALRVLVLRRLAGRGGRGAGGHHPLRLETPFRGRPRGLAADGIGFNDALHAHDVALGRGRAAAQLSLRGRPRRHHSHGGGVAHGDGHHPGRGTRAERHGRRGRRRRHRRRSRGVRARDGLGGLTLRRCPGERHAGRAGRGLRRVEPRRRLPGGLCGGHRRRSGRGGDARLGARRRLRCFRGRRRGPRGADARRPRGPRGREPRGPHGRHGAGGARARPGPRGGVRGRGPGAGHHEHVVVDGGRAQRPARVAPLRGLRQRDAAPRAGKGCEPPNFKGSSLGRFPLVSADFWTSDHLSERSRRVDAFSATRARAAHPR